MALRRPARDRRWRWRSDSSPFLQFVMWLARLAHPLLARAGVDLELFDAVLHAKVSLELRRAPEAGTAPVGDIALALTGLAFFGLGLMAGLGGLLLEGELQVWIAGSQGLLLAMLVFFLMVHYVSLLVDPLDIDVFAPHPVPDRTLFAARLAHVTIYVGAMGLSYTVPLLLLGPIAYPHWITVPLVPLACLATSATAVGATGLTMAVMLRVLGPRRFQRATLWLQIGFASLAFGGGQMVGRISRNVNLEFDWSPFAPLLWLLPPYHQLQATALLRGSVDGATLAGAALALLVPVALLVASVRLASRHFIAGLSGELRFEISRSRGWGFGPFVRLGRLLVREREERAGLEYCLALARREPQFLRVALPQLIGMQVMGFAMILNLGDLDEFGDTALRFALPGAISFLLLTLPTLLEMAQYSKDAAARWTLQVAPIEHPGALLSGSLKGLAIGMIAPVAALQLVFIAALLGARQIGPALLAFELTAIIALATSRRLELSLPFTRKIRAGGKQSFTNFGVVLAMLGLMFVMVLVHALLAWYAVVMWVAIAVLVPAVLRAWRGLRGAWPASGVLAD